MHQMADHVYFVKKVAQEPVGPSQLRQKREAKNAAKQFERSKAKFLPQRTAPQDDLTPSAIAEDREI